MSSVLPPAAGVALTRAAVASFFSCTLRGEQAECERLTATLAAAEQTSHP